jgi:ATP/maltotriose-dependent transcriptional regulator MalT
VTPPEMSVRMGPGMDDRLAAAREAFEQQRWRTVYECATDATGPLAGEDLDRLAVAAYLLGNQRDSVRAFERAHLAHARAGEPGRAARSAFWLAILLMLGGEMAPAEGWLARAERVAEEADDAALQALLAIPAFLGALEGGDVAAAGATATRMMEVAGRSADRDIRTLAQLSRGQALAAAGQLRPAMKLFDEAMVAVTAGEVSPIPAGIVYCAVIDACMQVCDFRRAAEWTNALARWCDAQPGLVPYRGQCLVHRSQVLQASGAWAEAMAEVERAEHHLSDPPHPALGMALYQEGELHRLRGAHGDADRAYRTASQHGRDPSPGLALLRLAEGNGSAAATMVRRSLREGKGSIDRPVVLAAATEVLLAAGDLEAARGAAAELDVLATDSGTAMLHAMAAYAAGCVELASGAADAALPSLRRACRGWLDLGMTYDVARAQVQLGRVCQLLDDRDTARMELEAARSTFARLGAAPDVAAVDRLFGRASAASHPLTSRECEVLRLVATCKRNREIAELLVISEHTVGRHLQNIFLKLDLSSRAAATAYAYEQGLV